MVAGCGVRPLAPNLGSIAVVPFETGEDVTAVSRYDGDRGSLGRAIADRVELILSRRKRNVKIVAPDQIEGFDTVVTGRILRLDGGNRALRAIVGMGAGGGSCAVDGEIRKDGRPIGTFAFAQKRRSTGWFWIRFGDSADRQLLSCMQALGGDIANVVDRGTWLPVGAVRVTEVDAQGRPSVPGANAGSRLKQLDALKAQGLLSEDEYRTKRQAIISEL